MASTLKAPGQLTADPGSGNAFGYWSGSASGTTNPLTVAMNSDKTISANFSTPVGAGTYDDTNTNIAYSGSWGTYNGSGPYNNTMHYSTGIGDTASISFTGTQVKPVYLRASNTALCRLW